MSSEKGRKPRSPPEEVLRNLLSRYLDRNREFYVEEFREALLQWQDFVTPRPTRMRHFTPRRGAYPALSTCSGGTFAAFHAG